MLTLTLILGLLGLLATPASAGHTAALPPAAGFHVSFQVSGARAGFTAELQGVANRTGELQATLSTTEPEAHTLDVIRANDTVYVSADGAPYETASDLASLAGSTATGLPPGGLPPGCQTTAAGFGALLKTASARQALSDLANVQDLGPATVGDTTTEHYTSSLDLGAVLANPLVQQTAGQVLSGCGGSGAPQLDPSLLQGVLAGSTVTADAYVDPTNGLPRQFSLTLNLQPLSLQFSADGTTTPMAAPASISVPQP